jgi:DNA primase
MVGNKMAAKPNQVQLDLTRRASSQMPEGCEIVAAMDADDAGRQAAKVVYNALQTTLRVEPHFTKREPPGFKDWNDHTRASKKSFFARVRLTEAQSA